MNYNEALQNCIFRYVSGSHQYGTNREGSDTDYRGVFIAPFSCAFDLFQTSFVGAGTIKQDLESAIEALDNGDPINARNHIVQALQTDRGDLCMANDTVDKPGSDESLHELRKFFKLASQCNPNIIEFLYVEHLIEIDTPIWEMIREKRHLFLCRRARYTFGQYAVAQLNRIKTHRGYLLNPPDYKPTRKEFGLPENTKIPKDHQNAICALPSELIADHAKEQTLQEKRYASALQVWNAYCKWDKERNPARKEIERRHGYDTKHAAHLVRLCRMAKEILRDGVVLVRRPDAEELKSILNGGWKYEEVEAFAENANAELDALYTASKLPQEPDREGIADLYKTVCERQYGIMFN